MLSPLLQRYKMEACQALFCLPLPTRSGGSQLLPPALLWKPFVEVALASNSLVLPCSLKQSHTPHPPPPTPPRLPLSPPPPA